MGRPFASELDELERTYANAMQADVEPFAAAIAGAAASPLLVIGSGGAFSAAYFVSQLHRRFTGQAASAVTPLGFVEGTRRGRDHFVMCLSAGGTNMDVRTAFLDAALSEYRGVLAVSMRARSALMKLSRRFRYTSALALSVTPKRDGFLATNSLIAFCVAATRAYYRSFGVMCPLPDRLSTLCWPEEQRSVYRKNLHDMCLSLCSRSTLAVLYGPTTETAALDLESKFVEAALGNVQLADYRNFAHGRHHWLAKHGRASAVLALSTSADGSLPARTLRLLPGHIPQARLELPGAGMTSSLSAIVACLHIVAEAGALRGIDPGRPGVPGFGSKVYGLRLALPRRLRGLTKSIEAAAVDRKIEMVRATGEEKAEATYRQALKRVMSLLSEARFPAAVFDYDGTLCSAENRFASLDPEVAAALERFLKRGVPIGVATGRGRSVHEALRASIESKYWPRMLVGYYNGAHCALLSDAAPQRKSRPCAALAPIARELRSSYEIGRLASIATRQKQVTLEVKRPGALGQVWREASALAARQDTPLRLTRSKHSVDVLAPGVSKLSVVAAVRELAGASTHQPILRIGDSGLWPGNDHELLATSCALSVDEVSPDPNSCWNLARRGHRGPQACLDYLQALVCSGKKIKFNLRRLSLCQRAEELRP